MALLSVRDVTRRFGGVLALDGVSLDVDEGEIAGLIGPNGAGKTTAFNVISGLLRADAGDVAFAGRSLARLPPHRIARRGVSRTFQNLALFPTMTVEENVLVGAHTRDGWGRGRRAGREVAYILERLGLAGSRRRPAGELAYGVQKRVELARALAAAPRLVLLDEPAAGLDHDEVRGLGETLRALRTDYDLTLLLVEHHMALVMGVSDRVYVLDFGRLIAAGAPADVRSDPAVVEAYLGEA